MLKSSTKFSGILRDDTLSNLITQLLKSGWVIKLQGLGGKSISKVFNEEYRSNYWSLMNTNN